MKKKTYFKIVVVLTITNMLWAFSYAYVGDVHPTLTTLLEVLKVKAIFNGIVLFILLCGAPIAIMELKD